MKIVVTGGAGFIASNVVDGYIEEGHEVVIIDNLCSGRVENINPKARFYLMDVRAREVQKVFELEKPDIVNHHAAQMSVPASVTDPAFDADVNILGLINLLECSVRNDTKKFIFISSGGAVYGESDTLPTPETYAPRPLSPYAISKLTSEVYLDYYLHQYDLKYSILRYANIYGPRQVPHAEAGVVSIFMSKLMAGEIPTIFHYSNEPDGMTRDYCFVKDIVKANLLTLEKADNAKINLGVQRETTTGELYRTILSAVRAKGYAMDGSFDSPNKKQARPGDLKRSCLSVQKAGELLGWSSEYSLKKGIEETFETYL